MKPHSTPPALLFFTAIATLGLASCVLPNGGYANSGYGSSGFGSRGYSSYGSGIGVYSSLPPGYAGNAYYHGNRYYSGGRYEAGSFNHQGRSYDGRYQQGNGQYLYGGEHQHYNGNSNNASQGQRSHASIVPGRGPGAGFFPGTGPSWRP